MAATAATAPPATPRPIFVLLVIPLASGVLDSEVVEELAVPSLPEPVVGDGAGASARVSDPVAVAPVSIDWVPDMLMGSLVDSVSFDVASVVVGDGFVSSVSDGDAEAVWSSLSLLCQFIWIIGANKLKAVIFASALGTVCEATSLTSEPSHVAMDTVVDVATVKHVWPPKLAHW